MPNPIPSGEGGIGAHRLEHVEREVEPVSLLGVHRKADAHVACRLGERRKTCRQLTQHALPLGGLEARVQRRQLDRDAGGALNGASLPRLSDRRDRRAIGVEIALRVARGVRRLAQHVERIAPGAVVALVRPIQRFLDRTAHHELARHDAHRGGDRAADHRVAAREQPAQHRGEVAISFPAYQPAGQHQPPARRIDEQRFRVAEMALPVGVAQLVADQALRRFGVGNAQQRLCEAHQNHALTGREVELVQERVEFLRH